MRLREEMMYSGMQKSQDVLNTEGGGGMFCWLELELNEKLCKTLSTGLTGGINT